MEQAQQSRRPTSDEEHTFELPHLSERRWCRVIDTMQMPPHDGLKALLISHVSDTLISQGRAWRYG